MACLAVTGTASAQCGNGVIGMGEACDDGNMLNGDGCSMGCVVETGFGCVPTLFATGVNDAGDALPSGAVDPHWTWSQTNDESTAVPAIATQNAAWPNHPPGRWVSASVNFGNELTTGINTFWFQRVEVPAAFVGALSFPIVVSCDNTCEVFVTGLLWAQLVPHRWQHHIPASAFLEGSNLVTVRLVEGTPGTPRGILIYPGGGGILSQCTERCMSNAECDDGNDCTTDTCLLTACTNSARVEGSSCTGGACNGDPLFPMCVACVDTSPAGMDAGCGVSAQHCRTTGVGSPVCEPCLDTAMGSGTDQGCAAGSPYCVAGVGGNSCLECLSGADCSDANTCTQDVCTAGTCSNPLQPVGTPCAGGACNGTLPICELCVDSGGGTDTGCSAGTPNCIGASGMRQCVECTVAGQCDDGIACTTDACTANVCASAPVAEGMTGACTGGTVCSGAPTNLCVACTDTSAMGTDAGCMAMEPHCRTSGSGSPTCEECLDSASGLAVDLGCSMGNPLCVGGSCVACISGADCSDSDTCTDDVCTAGVCSNPPETQGTPCSGGVCDGMASALCEVCVDNGSGVDFGCNAIGPALHRGERLAHVRGLHGGRAVRRQQPVHGGQLRVERV